MSKVIGSSDCFAVIRAAVRKDMASAVLADAVRVVAYKYARQGGAKPLLDSLIVDAKTGANGKARSFAKGSLVACVFTSLTFIAENGPRSLARDAKREDREFIAQTFADTVAFNFSASVEAGAVARKEKAEEKKAEKKAEAEAVTDSTAEKAPTETQSEETDWKALYLAALAENEALKAQIQTLQSKKAKNAEKKVA